jgi:uncharacterized protein YegJ (DUF2314 family)
MKPYLFILICFLFTLKANCQTAINDSMEYASVDLVKDDKVFLALKDTAQKHLARFISKLSQHGREFKSYRFLVKSDFVQNDHHEHMWSRVFEYKDGVFNGVFIDSAFTVRNIKMGDKVLIKRNGIEDRAINKVGNNAAIDGGFSEKYLKNKMKKPGK